MNHQHLKYSVVLIALAVVALVMFSSCEDKGNGDCRDDETEVWESF